MSSWRSVIALVTMLIVIYISIRRKEHFFGMSPGTLTQLQSSHVPSTLLVPFYHRFKPWDQFGAENAALKQTPMPYLIY
jgi:hypothetical protein